MSEKFTCAAPWRGLHINPRGDIKTCCAGDPNMLGNLNEQSIDQVLNSPLMIEIRQSLRSGVPHRYCYNCVSAERYGSSERQWHNSVNPDFDSATAGDLEHIPTLIDVRWNTTCNMSCNYCGDKCSSRWAALKKIEFRSGTRPYYEQVCDYLEQHRDSIKEVALVGGEPLLLPENDRLLDVLPDNCTVTLITNLNVDFATNKIVKKLEKRNQVGWSMSFDNIGDRFEYVRHGGQWSLLLKNIEYFKQLREAGHWGGIHSVFNIYNGTRLIELTQFARQHDISVHWQTLYQPACLDPLHLGEQAQQAVKDQIEKLLSMHICLPAEESFFRTVLGNWQPKQTLITEFQQHISDIEYRYHTDQTGQFVKLWPELEFLYQDTK